MVPALAKILLYLVLVVLTGAVLAPPIYWLLHPALDFPFYRYLSRVTQIAAFVLLGPLLYWLGIRRTKEFGLEQNPRAAKDFVAGLVLALMPGIALCELGRNELRRGALDDFAIETSLQLIEQRLLAP